MLATNKVHLGDSVELLGKLEENSVDLVFADPPFNIGYDYDTYDDRMEYDAYVEWSKQWMAACQRVLRPTGSFYIAIGDEFAAEIRTIGRELGMHLRNWIIWHYTFGQSTKAKFARAHAHIFYFVMDPKVFTFNDEMIRVPSARHTEYSDKRANPMGKTPDDVWNEFPRVCGTYRERQGWHGCQMPEALLARIIRCSSNPGDLVIDPFSGSGTTVVTAAKLGRRYIGIDLSKQYVEQGRKRLKAFADEPARVNGDWSAWETDSLCSMFRETGAALDRLLPNEVALECFTRLLNVRLGRSFTPEQVRETLQKLDRESVLPRLRNDRPYNPAAPNGKPPRSAGANGSNGSAGSSQTTRRQPRKSACAEGELLFSDTD